MKIASSLAATLLLAVSASAGIVYDFQLPANGNVDVVQIQVTLRNYIAENDFRVFNLGDPGVVFAVGTNPVDLGFIGIQPLAASTLIGVALFDANGDTIQLTVLFPNDFFAFGRTPRGNGTWSSTGGFLISSGPYVLASASPVTGLTVSGTPDVPEPASILTFAGGAALLFLLRRSRRNA
jgi:hypothetical protein